MFAVVEMKSVLANVVCQMSYSTLRSLILAEGGNVSLSMSATSSEGLCRK